jgi:K+-transporting ATPase ATPase C chain
MMKEIRPAIVLLVALTVLTGLIYPLVMTGIAESLFPYQSQGSLIERNGRVIGSELIGQQFTEAKYFHGRPSATTAADPQDASKSVAAPYNAANSMGSNLGPASRALAERIGKDVAVLRRENPSSDIPVDLVTASGSGLDPDISPQAAQFQAPRIAAARGLPEAAVTRLIAQHTESRSFGVLGEPRVNVLKLNLALDKMRP